MKNPPKLDQINLISSDLKKSIAFYDLLGVSHGEVFTDADGKPMHINGEAEGGLDLDWDDVDFAKVWNTGWRGAEGLAGRVVVGFRLATREEVDEATKTMEAAGYKILQPAYDAFWGARYAIVEDPDGIAVGLMSPPDPDLRSRPPDI